MLISRNGRAPVVHPAAIVAPSAQIVGDVTIGAGSYIDYNVVIASAGPPIVIGERVIVFATAVIRSTGGEARPAHPVHIGAETLISPLCALAGCTVGANCYIATGAIVLQGADIGDGVEGVHDTRDSAPRAGSLITRPSAMSRHREMPACA